MVSTIDFYFDFLSPYAYLAHTQLPGLAQRHGLRIEYHPIDLQQAKLAVGNTGPSNREMPIKHRHLRLDLQRWAALYGAPLVPPAAYGSTRLNLGMFYAMAVADAQRYADSAWHRVWGKGGAMDDDNLLRGLAGDLGWPVDEFLSYVGSNEATQRLATSNAEALRRGVFGVPTMLVGDEMWWGNDRLHFLESHLQSRAKQ
jgi:2-hydroxychromene-2-carboxylate isomerase